MLRRYRTDRFVQPASTALAPAACASRSVLAARLPADFEVLTLAPLAPLGTHSALGPVSQDKVVTAMRACEAAADPTNALALEAAARRVASRGAAVRLAAFQRVVRAQHDRAGRVPGPLQPARAGQLPGAMPAATASSGMPSPSMMRAVAAGLHAAGFAASPAGADAADARGRGDRRRSTARCSQVIPSQSR